MVYLDWKAQEIGIAAALAHDQALMQAYRDGDVYYAFARAAGLTDDPDQQHWKDNNKTQRQRMKALQLAIGYGMGVPSLAKGINQHPLIASGLIEWHRRLYPAFWEWREDQVQRAMLNRRIESIFGWPLHISTSPNERTLYNFGAQANGAECLRLAAWRLCEVGIVPSMLIHDGILIEVRDTEQIEQAIEIMRAAGRDVCGGFELDVEKDQVLKPGQRYRDKRELAQQMWDTIMNVLESVRAVPRRVAS
jgi:DNA polymerase I-like protein with 3'-5' exonuclease and polymerase domains